jgi:hypothetical protein
MIRMRIGGFRSCRLGVFRVSSLVEVFGGGSLVMEVCNEKGDV